MEWLIIAGAILLIITPVFWLLPTARQRHETRQRQHAMRLGLKVTLARLPHPDPTPEELVDGAGRERHPVISCARYALGINQKSSLSAGVVWRTARSGATAMMSGHGLPDGWQWYGTSGQPPKLTDDLIALITATIEGLPDDTLALEGTSREVALFWREAGDTAQVDKVFDLLASLARPPNQTNAD